MVTGVCLKPNDGSNPFMPTAESLLGVGMHQVYEPPIGTKFDVVECAVCIICFIYTLLDFMSLNIITLYCTC